MALQPHVVTDQLSFGEGPVWCDDGTLVCSSIADGALYRIWPQSGRMELVADTAGGPNGAVLAADGSFAVANNGGVDLKAMGRIPDQPPVRFIAPCLQWAKPDGSVATLTVEAMQAPNDLAVGPDGSIYFTDPGGYPGTDIARVMRLGLDGTARLIGGGFRYTNGIAFDPGGASFVVIEDDFVLARWHDLGAGGREILVERLSDDGGDGVALDVDGRYYVACKRSNAVAVFDREGSPLEVLPAPPGGNALVTNLCFGGDDLRTLFATDSHRRLVIAWEHMPTPGLPMRRWPQPSTTDLA